jgi:hypothetical protein
MRRILCDARETWTISEKVEMALKSLNGKYLAALMDQYRKLLSGESATVRESVVYTRI